MGGLKPGGQGTRPGGAVHTQYRVLPSRMLELTVALYMIINLQSGTIPCSADPNVAICCKPVNNEEKTFRRNLAINKEY